MIFMEAAPRDPASGNAVTIRAVSAFAGAGAVNSGGHLWLPAIARAPRYSIDIFGSELTGALRVDYGEVGLRFSPQLGNDDWSRLQWDGAPLSLWLGDGSGLANAEPIFTGRAGPMERMGANTGRLTLRGAEAQLDKPLLTATYAGTGGAEGSAALLGAVRPWCSGVVMAASGVLIDPVHWVWQVHGYGAIHAVTAAYEMGVGKGASSGDYPDYAALTGATLSESEWATCTAQGLVRFGGEPLGRVCFDVEGAVSGGTFPRRIGAVAAHLLEVAGIDGAHISTASASVLDAAFPHDWGAYVTMPATVGDVVRQALSDVAGYAFPDGAGVWRFGRFCLGKEPTPLSAQRNTPPLVRDIRQVATASPAGEVQVGGARCWTVHDASEISPALLEMLNAPTNWGDIADPDGTKPEDGATRTTPRGDWSASIAYLAGDVVTYMGRSFIALQANTNRAPPNANSSDGWWQLLAGKGDKGDKGDGAAGLNAITLSLSRTAINIYTHSDGSGGDYSLAVGKAVLRDGASDVTASAALSVSTSGVTGGIDASGNYAVTALSADSGTLTIAAAYNGETYTADVTVNRIRTGTPKYTEATQPATGNEVGDVIIRTDKEDALYIWRDDGTGPKWVPMLDAAEIAGLSDLLEPLDTGLSDLQARVLHVEANAPAMEGGNQYFDDGKNGWGGSLAEAQAGIETTTMTAAPEYSGARNVLTFGGTRGNAVSWKIFPVVPGRTYRVRARAGFSGPSTVAFLGVQTNGADGQPVGTNSGHTYLMASGQSFGPGWRDLEATFKAEDLTAGTTGVRLVAYLNYASEPTSSGALDYFTIADIADAEDAYARAHSEITTATGPSSALAQSVNALEATVDTPGTGLTAKVRTQAGAIATLQGENKAYLQTVATAGAATAFTQIVARDSYGGAPRSEIDFGASQLGIWVPVAGQPDQWQGVAEFTAGGLKVHGEVDADSIGTNQLKAGAVTAATLAANSVNSQKVGTNKLSANVIDLDGLTLFNKAGQLAIKSAGVDTEQIATNAVNNWWLAQLPSANTVINRYVKTQLMSLTVVKEQGDSPLNVSGMLPLQNSSDDLFATYYVDVLQGATTVATQFNLVSFNGADGTPTNMPVSYDHIFTGLAAGTYTVKVSAQSTNPNSSMTLRLSGAAHLYVQELKK